MMWHDAELDFGKHTISPNSIIEVSTVAQALFKPVELTFDPLLNQDNFDITISYEPVTNCDYATTGVVPQNAFKTLVVGQRVSIKIANRNYLNKITTLVSIKLQGKEVD